MKTCNDNNASAAFFSFYQSPGLFCRTCRNPQAPLGDSRAFTRLFSVILDFTPGRCYSGRESKFQPLLAPSQLPMEPPCPQRWTHTHTHPPIPVGVGVDGACDGYERPRDESSLQGQLEGDFLGDNGDLLLAESHLQSDNTPGAPRDTVSIHATPPTRDSQPQVLPGTGKIRQRRHRNPYDMMEPLPWEEPVPPAEGGAQIQGHWAVARGRDTVLILLVLLDMVLILLVLQDTAPVLRDMAPVLQGMLLVLQDMLPVLLGMRLVLLESQDRCPEDRNSPGTPPEPAAGSPRRASLGVGGQRGSGCCRGTRRQTTGERGERRRVRWVA